VTSSVAVVEDTGKLMNMIKSWLKIKTKEKHGL